MGVHGLWTLLEPVGRRIDIQAISNKRLAVDASIWLYQFIRAMRMPDGEMMKNAHLLGFFRRICKLLFHKVQPIFVFEGTVPALKRQTIAARHARRETHTAGLKRAAEKLVINHIKRQALLEAQRQRQEKRQQQQQQQQQQGQDAAAAQEGSTEAPASRPAKRQRSLQASKKQAAADDSNVPSAAAALAAAAGEGSVAGQGRTWAGSTAAAATAAAGSSRGPAGGPSAAAAAAVGAVGDLSRLSNAELEELQLSFALEVSAAAAEDPKGKRPANRERDRLQQQVQDELQRRAAARGDSTAAASGEESQPGLSAAAAAAAERNEGQVTVDEQLARELDEALNRGRKRKADSQQPEGPRLFNFEQTAAAAAGEGEAGSRAADDEDALLAAALAALDAEDAAAAAEAAEAQAAAAGAAAEARGNMPAAATVAAAAGAGAGDGEDQDEQELVVQQRRQRRRRAVQQRRQQQQQQDVSDQDESMSEGYQESEEEGSEDSHQQQQQQSKARPRRQKQLSAAQQQQQKLLGALARRTQRQQQEGPAPSAAAAAAAGDADWEPDDQAEEDAALLGFRGRVGVINSDDDDSDGDGGGGELLLPADVSNLDPAVLSTLPQSVQLDILEKMRDAQQTANREKFLTAAASAPKNFSQVQMDAYLKASRFRQTIEQYKRAMGGGTAMGPTPAGQQLQGRKLASEHTREFIFARQQQQQQQSSTALLSGGFAPDPSQQQQQQQQRRFQGPASPGSRPRRRNKVDKLLEELREARKQDTGLGIKPGELPKQSVAALKGLAAFSSVLKSWGALEEQGEAEDAAAELGLGAEGAAAAAADGKVESGLLAPVKLEPGPGTQPGMHQAAGVRSFEPAAAAGSTAAVVAARTAAQAALAAVPGAHMAHSVPGPVNAGTTCLAAGPASGVQLQLPLLDVTVDAADDALFGGMGLSSSSEGEEDAMQLDGLPAGQPPAATVAAAAAAAAGGGGGGGGNSSEEWEDVVPVTQSQQQQQQQQTESQPLDQQQQQQEEDRRPGWRERMALRQKFWSTSHGFKLGRKLGDWAAAEQLGASQGDATAAGDGAQPPGPAAAAAAPAAGAGVVAAVIGGALGRSPVKPRVGAQRLGSRGVSGIVGGELGSDEEEDAEMQAAIQLSLAEAGSAQPGSTEPGSTQVQSGAGAQAVGGVQVQGGADSVQSVGVDVVMISNEEDWEDVVAPDTAAAAAAASVTAAALPSAPTVPAGAAGRSGVDVTAAGTGQQRRQQQQQQQQVSAGLDADGSNAVSIDRAIAPAVINPPAVNADQQQGAGSNGRSGGAASVAALYNSKSHALLEQHPAAAPSRPENVAAIKRDLMAAAEDAAAAIADAREYPDAKLLQTQAKEQQQEDQQELVLQGEVSQQQEQEQEQQQQAATKQVASTKPSALPAPPAGSAAAAAAAAAAVDFSFLDDQPALVRPRQKSPAAVAAGGGGGGAAVGLRARATPPKPPPAPVVRLASQPQQHHHQQQQRQSPAGADVLQEREAPQPQQQHVDVAEQQQQHAAPTQQQQSQQDMQMPPPPARAPPVQVVQEAAGARSAGTALQHRARAQQAHPQPVQQEQQQQQQVQAQPQLHQQPQPQPQPMQQQQQQQQQQAAGADQAREPAALVDIDAELANLAAESSQLRSRLTTAARNTATPTQDMIAECQELLTLFGLPYITAPAEAEAQCAWLEAAGLVDGVVTDDNDAFLFGAQHIYRHMFEDKKYVEEYHMSDIERELGVDRGRLVCLAMLLGSDYTEGVAGIGVVNALEVVSAWPGGLAGLAGFKQWLDSPDERILAAATAALRDARGEPSCKQVDKQAGAVTGSKRGRSSKAGSRGRGRNAGTGKGRGQGRGGRKGRGGRAAAEESSSSEDESEEEASVPDSEGGAAGPGAGADTASGTAEQDSSMQEDGLQQEQGSSGDTPAQRRFKSTHRGVARSWNLPAHFPNNRVHDAYLQPLVDCNPAKFNFGRPNGDLLVQFCRDSFGWDKSKADDVLKPVLTSYAERTTQLRIDQFLTQKQRFAKIRSKRLQQAVTAIVASTGSDVNPELFYASTEHMPDLPKGGGVLAKESQDEAANSEPAEL